MDNIEALEAKAAAAEAEAEAARSKVNDLEAAIVAGDSTITLSDIESQERVARTADLNARAARSRIDDAQRAQRAAELSRIHDEIKATNRPDLTALLRKVENAAKAFTAAALDHNDNVYRWRSELIRLGCEPTNHPADIDPADNGVAPGGQAGVVYVDGSPLMLLGDIESMVQEAGRRGAGGGVYDVYAELATCAVRP